MKPRLKCLLQIVGRSDFSNVEFLTSITPEVSVCVCVCVGVWVWWGMCVCVVCVYRECVYVYGCVCVYACVGVLSLCYASLYTSR